MSPDTIFKITCIVAAVGWIIILVLSPFWMRYDKFVVGIVIALLALTYTAINVFNFDPGILKKFSTLDGVAEIFQDKPLLTAAWTHIMAFDLLVAVWIKNNSVKHGIGHLIILPSIIFSCVFGPLGFLIYLLTRWIKTKNYFAENFS